MHWMMKRKIMIILLLIIMMEIVVIINYKYSFIYFIIIIILLRLFFLFCRELLEQIKDFEEHEFAGATRDSDFRHTLRLQPLNESGGTALLNMVCYQNFGQTLLFSFIQDIFIILGAIHL